MTTQGPVQAETSKTILNCKFEEKAVGKAFKNTKLKLRWDFEIANLTCYVELYDSKISGKKKVVVNGKTIFEPKAVKAPFSFSFLIDGSPVNLVQNGPSYDLKINNALFSDLLANQLNTEQASEGSAFEKDTAKDTAKEANTVNSENKSEINGNVNGNALNKESSTSGKNGVNNVDLISDKMYSNQKEKTENLLEFGGQEGSRPSKINILDLSPLNSPAKEPMAEEKSSLPQIEQESNTQIINEPSESKSEDINDLFDSFNLSQPKKEPSKLDKFREMYQSSFVENEAAQIDPIYNVFGGASFNYYNYNIKNYQHYGSHVSSAYSSPHIAPRSNSGSSKSMHNFQLAEKIEKVNTSETTASPISSKQNSNEAKKNFYPSFDDMKAKLQKFEKKNSAPILKDNAPVTTTSTTQQTNNIFDMFN